MASTTRGAAALRLEEVEEFARRFMGTTEASDETEAVVRTFAARYPLPELLAMAASMPDDGSARLVCEAIDVIVNHPGAEPSSRIGAGSLVSAISEALGSASAAARRATLRAVSSMLRRRGPAALVLVRTGRRLLDPLVAGIEEEDSDVAFAAEEALVAAAGAAVLLDKHADAGEAKVANDADADADDLSAEAGSHTTTTTKPTVVWFVRHLVHSLVHDSDTGRDSAGAAMPSETLADESTVEARRWSVVARAAQTSNDVAEALVAIEGLHPLESLRAAITGGAATDPLAALAAIELVPALGHTVAGLTWLTKSGLMDTLTEYAGYSHESAREPDPFLGASSAEALAECLARASSLRFESGMEPAASLARSLRLRVTPGALRAAARTADDRSGDDAAYVHAVGCLATALARDEASLAWALDVSPPVLLRSVLEEVTSSIADRRRATQHAIARVLRAATVAPPTAAATPEVTRSRSTPAEAVHLAAQRRAEPSTASDSALFGGLSVDRISPSLRRLGAGRTLLESLWLETVAACGRSDAGLLRGVTTPVLEDREAALDVCEALAGQPSGWGARAMASIAGLWEALLDRDPATDDKPSLELQHAVLRAAARHGPALSDAVGPALAEQIIRVASRGAVVPGDAAPLVGTMAL